MVNSTGSGAACAPDPDSIFGPIREALADRPYVIAQLGQSLDGRIATVSGESRYINGRAALDHLHRLRAHVDAVVVGAGTIAADDPQLTVRRVEGRSPARFAIDPTGRLAGQRRWLTPDGVPCYVITLGERAAPAGAQAIALRGHNGVIAPADMVAAIHGLGYRRILIEGGARTISMFMDAGCVDRLHMLVAPCIIGSGRPGLELAPIARLADARRPASRVHVLDDGDVLFDCDLRASGRPPEEA